MVWLGVNIMCGKKTMTFNKALELWAANKLQDHGYTFVDVVKATLEEADEGFGCETCDYGRREAGVAVEYLMVSDLTQPTRHTRFDIEDVPAFMRELFEVGDGDW